MKQKGSESGRLRVAIFLNKDKGVTRSGRFLWGRLDRSSCLTGGVRSFANYLLPASMSCLVLYRLLMVVLS